ncbi:MAG: TolC family protein [Gammaproteobacteria bacterium]|nr:TolC family protein [Gammaproteobacteria bacterium]
MFRFKVALFLSLIPAIAWPEALSLDVALVLASGQAPDVVEQSASVATARAAARSAGRLPDPQLLIGIENLPVSGPERWSLTREAMTMYKLGLMQALPNGARRRAEADAAHAAVERAAAAQRVRQLEIRRDTALAWLERYYLERRTALLDGLQRENELFTAAIDAQLAAGRVSPADALGPRAEAADLADRRDELAAALQRARAALRRWVGPAGDAPLAGEPPTLPIDADRMRTHVHEHLDLAVYVPMTAMAQAEVHAAEAARRPDWGMELSYGRRGAAFGDMLSLQVTMGLPLFQRARQGPTVEARRQALARVEAERAVMLRDHQRDLEAELASYASRSSQLQRLRAVRLPLARQKVDYQLASYRGGRVEIASVLQARRELIETELRALDLEAARAAAAARLYYVYGEGAQ